MHSHGLRVETKEFDLCVALEEELFEPVIRLNLQETFEESDGTEVELADVSGLWNALPIMPDVSPSVIFLGEAYKPGEVTLSEATDCCAADSETDASQLSEGLRSSAVETFDCDDRDEFMLRWFKEEQDNISKQVTNFVMKQQVQLEGHRKFIELQFFQQRVGLKKVLSESRRWKSSRSRSVSSELQEASGPRSVHFDGDSFTTTDVNRDAESVCTAVSVNCSRQVSRIGTNNSGDFAKGRSRSTHRGRVSMESKADRLRRAYEDAAQHHHSHSSRFNLLPSFLADSPPPMHWRLFELPNAEVMVEGACFQKAIAGLICFNAVFIGITTNMSMERSLEAWDRQASGVYADIPRPAWADFLDTMFNILFAAEFFCRATVLQGKFCAGNEWRWNLFDGIVVVLSFAEMTLAGMGFNPSFIRLLRVIRVVRSIRMLRLMRFARLVRKLRVVTVAIINCSSMLMWAVLVLVLVTFLFSVVFLNAVAQHISDAPLDDPYVDGMREYFYSLPMTMLTLFMAVAGGIDWWEVVKLLLEIHVIYVAVFIFFVIITVLAVLNVINAIFVNDAMESTRTDPDLRMQGELEDTTFMLRRLTTIYDEMVSLEGAEDILSDKQFVEQVESQQVKMQLSLMGLYYTDGLNFFKLLDADGNGWLTVDEFVMGCLRLKGGALQIDSTVLIRETKDLVKKSVQDNRRTISTITTIVKALGARLMDPDLEFCELS